MKPTDFPSALTRRLLGQGQEPDPRFTLANERTFLAWIRTALALLASGIAVEAFALEMFSPGAKQALVVGLLSLSLIVSLSAFYRWLSVERALRQQAALPMSLFTPVLSLSCAALIVGVMAMFWGATMSDAGLQPERTSLAWKRTQIQLILVICMAFRCLQYHSPLVTALVFVTALLALLALVEQRLSYRRGLLGIAGRIPTCNPRPVLVLSFSSVLLAVLALFSVLTTV